MSKKYTAADFANAKFAEHPAERNFAARVYEEDEDAWFDGTLSYTDVAMSCSGWVPVPTKPVLTESRIKKMVGDYAVDEFAAGFVHGFRRAGGEIIPDPEPTNTERLTGLLKKAPVQSIDAWAKYLNDHGVTAPNVKDN